VLKFLAIYEKSATKPRANLLPHLVQWRWAKFECAVFGLFPDATQAVTNVTSVLESGSQAPHKVVEQMFDVLRSKGSSQMLAMASSSMINRARDKNEAIAAMSVGI